MLFFRMLNDLRCEHVLALGMAAKNAIIISIIEVFNPINNWEN